MTHSRLIAGSDGDQIDPIVPTTSVQSPRVPLLGPAWPIAVICLGVPIGFFVGVHAIIWILPAALYLPLLYKRDVYVPISATPLILLLGWMLLSIIMMTGLSLWPLTIYRWLMFASTLAIWLWLLNTSEESLPTRRVVDLLAAFWIALIAMGYLAILFPTVSVPSLMQQILPGGIANEPFIRDLTTLRFTEIQVFSDTIVTRPAAPLPYANGWGSTVGLLSPFFFAAFFVGASPRRLRTGIVLAVLGLIPIVVSANRGLWLSLFVGALYLAVRRTLAGDWRALAVLITCVAVVFSLITLTGISTVISSKLEDSEDSNEQRSGLYAAALDATMDSPLLGYGSTITGEYQHPVGTHGLLWYVMFVHGFPAAALVIIWAVSLLVGSVRAESLTGLLAHVSILIFLLQIPIYGLLPQVVLVGIAAGIASRELRRRSQAKGVTCSL